MSLDHTIYNHTNALRMLFLVGLAWFIGCAFSLLLCSFFQASNYYTLHFSTDLAET